MRLHRRRENADIEYEVLSMTSSDDVPLWDSVMHPFANALDLAFGCRHGQMSRVFTIDGRSYQVCCACGERFNYSWETMSIVRRRRRFMPVLRTLRARRRHSGRKLLSGFGQR